MKRWADLVSFEGPASDPLYHQSPGTREARAWALPEIPALPGGEFVFLVGPHDFRQAQSKVEDLMPAKRSSRKWSEQEEED